MALQETFCHKYIYSKSAYLPLSLPRAKRVLPNLMVTETSGGTPKFLPLHPAPFPSISHCQLIQAEFPLCWGSVCKALAHECLQWLGQTTRSVHQFVLQRAFFFAGSKSLQPPRSVTFLMSPILSCTISF